MSRRPLSSVLVAAALAASSPACGGDDDGGAADDGGQADAAPGTAADASGADAGEADAGGTDAGNADAGSDDGGPPDGGGPGAIELRITEINPAGQADLVELVAIAGGSLDGISVAELTNSGFTFAFPAGSTVAAADVIVLHLADDCTDTPTDRAACGNLDPYSDAAWDFAMPGSFSYSGKVLEILAAGAPMDAVPFVESSGTAPASYVAAVQQIQSEGLWDATPCIDDPSTGLARDRFCRNISVNWDDLDSDGSNSVTRLRGDDPLRAPGQAGQWSAALPSSWGTY